MRTQRYKKEIEYNGETRTIDEWSQINKEKPVTIYNRWRRNHRHYATYTNGQIVGSEDLPEPKKTRKPEVYKKRNIKARFDGSKLMLAFSKFNLLNATKFVYDEKEGV